MNEMDFAVKGTCSTGHKVESISISEKEAKKIAGFFARKVPWLEHVNIHVKNDRKYLLGRITYKNAWRKNHDVELFGIGLNAGVLLHELAHIKVHGHSFSFVSAYKCLCRIWDENEAEIEEMFVDKVKSLPCSEVIEYLMEESIEGEAITKMMVGEELMEIGKNTVENFNSVVSELKELGIEVR